MSEVKLSCWVISDGRRGIENQALGLAQSCKQLRDIKIKTHILTSKGLFKKASPAMQYSLKSKPKDYGLDGPAPDLVIGCGRQAIAPLRALKSAYSDDIFTVYVQDPRTDHSYFDLIIAPQHDDIQGGNIEPMIGSPNKVTKTQIVGETISFADRLNDLPMPRIAVMIGGPSKARGLSRETHAQHIAALSDLIAKGHSLMISTSRRTPDWVENDYKRLESDHDHVWLYTGGDNNPYFAFLGGAEAIFVTEESTNMLTEACATGKPVYRLAMDGAPAKFEQLYRALEQRCGVKPYEGKLDLNDYEPLNETARIAERLWAHFDMRDATLN